MQEKKLKNNLTDPVTQTQKTDRHIRLTSPNLISGHQNHINYVPNIQLEFHPSDRSSRGSKHCTEEEEHQINRNLLKTKGSKSILRKDKLWL